MVARSLADTTQAGQDHPPRPIHKMVDEMSPKFSKLYSDVGRPSIAPERLLRSLLLQIFYAARSERMLIEQLQYNLLFRWFVGMGMDEAVWNHAVYSKNRERLLNEEIAESFYKRVLERAKLSCMGHVLMENRNGLFGAVLSNRCEWPSGAGYAAMLMVEAIPLGKRVTERTTRHTGYEVSQRKRKRVEQSLGWMRMIGTLKKVKLRGIDKVGWLFTFTGAAYNLCRLRNLMAQDIKRDFDFGLAQ